MNFQYTTHFGSGFFEGYCTLLPEIVKIKIFLKKYYDMCLGRGGSRTLFSSVFPRNLFGIVSKVCDVYIQNIRLVNSER